MDGRAGRYVLESRSAQRHARVGGNTRQGELLIDLEDVVADLRVVQARASTADRLLGLELPALDELTGSIDGRLALPGIVFDAIERLPDVRVRNAGHALLPFPYNETEWGSLKTRGGLAAKAYGVAFDTFRKTGPDRPKSRQETLLEEIARQLLTQLAPDQAAEQTPARGRKWPLAAAGIAVATVIAVLVILIVGRDDAVSHRQAAGAGARQAPACNGKIGELGQSVAHENDPKKLTSRLLSAFKANGGMKRLGCAAAAAERWQSLVVQTLAHDGTSNGALVLIPDGTDRWMNNAAYRSYHQIGSRDGNMAQLIGGLPQRVVHDRNGQVEIDLSTGAVLVAERDDAPYFWIAAAYVPWWRSHPEVGRPVGNPLPAFRQDFSQGLATVQPGDREPQFSDVPDPSSQLPAGINGRILRQVDGTAWLIKREGSRLVRRWIPDGGTWVCLGGDRIRVQPDLPGFVIASLPFAGQARCPRA